MLWMVSIGAGTAGALIVVMALLLRRLISPTRCEFVSAEWLTRFSVARYRPMERLFSDGDYRYLSQQEGFRPEMAERLRRERIAVFHGYLKCISADFRRLEAAVSLCMVNASEDMPELAKALLKRRLQFFWALTAARWRVLLYGFGVTNLDVRRLVDSLDDMRVHVRQLALAREGTLA